MSELERATATVASSPLIREVLVEFQNTETGEYSRYSLSVAHGRYYLDIGLLVPLVPGGAVRVRAARLSGTDELVYTLEEDLHTTAALALNIFPGGHRIGSLSGLRDWVWSDIVGLQIAIDLGLSNLLDQFYFGVLLEVVQGVSFSGGIALLRNEALPHGANQGSLVGSAGQDAARDDYRIHPYLGFTLTTDVLDLVIRTKDLITPLNP